MTVNLRFSCQSTFVRGVVLTTFGLLAQGAFAVTVDCGAGQKISSALAPGAVIKIIGTCKENLVITQDDVTLKKAPGQPKPKLRSKSKANKSAIVIDGARRVRLTNLVIFNSLNGVVATNGATFTLSTSTVKTNVEHGIVISNNASGEINDSIVRSNGFAGVRVVRGANLVMNDSTVKANNIDDLGWSGLNIHRGATGTINNSNIINNGGEGVTVSHNAQVQLSGNTISGNGTIKFDNGDGTITNYFHAGVGVYNFAMARFAGGNLVENNAYAAVEVYSNSVVRQGLFNPIRNPDGSRIGPGAQQDTFKMRAAVGGEDPLNGDITAIEAGRNSIIDFRNAIVDGHLTASSGTYFEIRFGEVTNGTAFCNDESPMVRSSVTYNGGTFNKGLDCL